MSTLRTVLGRDVPPIPDAAENVARAAAYRDSNWNVFCCTALVGVSDGPEEYVEPHWLIGAIENQGWQLERLDYLCVELERIPHVVGEGSRPSIRIEAKLMFRRASTPVAMTAPHEAHP